MAKVLATQSKVLSPWGFADGVQNLLGKTQASKELGCWCKDL